MAIDPNIAAQIVLCEKPRISEDVSGYDSNLLDTILNNLGTLSSIYVKPPELFVKKTKKVNLGEEEETDYEENAININENEVESINQNIKRRESNRNQEEEQQQQVRTEKASSGGNLLDLNDILTGASVSSASTNQSSQQQKPTNMSIDMMNIFESNSNVGSMIDNFNSVSINVKKPAVIPKQVVLSENTPGFTNKSTGLCIEASLQREMSGLNLIMTFYNKTSYPIQDFEIQFNKNYFGLSANSNQLRGMILQPGAMETKNIEISITSPDHMKVPSYDPPVLLQTAIRCNLDEYYFTVPIMFCALFEPQNMKCSFEDYQGLWASVQAPKDLFLTINNLNQKYQYQGVR